jgi:hypothetical protein
VAAQHDLEQPKAALKLEARSRARLVAYTGKVKIRFVNKGAMSDLKEFTIIEKSGL